MACKETKRNHGVEMMDRVKTKGMVEGTSGKNDFDTRHNTCACNLDPFFPIKKIHLYPSSSKYIRLNAAIVSVL